MYTPPKLITINFVVVLLPLWIVWTAPVQVYDSKDGEVCIASG